MLCECGCGNLAPIQKKTRKGQGHQKGEPSRFIKGHHHKGKGRYAHITDPLERRKAWRIDHPNADRITNLKRLYGLTIEGYDSLLLSQDGHCAICPSGDDLVVDHDHQTNEVRGILCRKHNLGIGHLDDDPTIVQKALEYLTNGNANGVGVYGS